MAMEVDVSVEDQVVNFFREAIHELGGLDIFVSNAARTAFRPALELSSRNWRRIMELNAEAFLLGSRMAFELMKANGGGRIVNIGSISAQRVRSNNAAYSAAKFGLVGLTHTTALEGRQYGINCGILHPGEVLHENRPIEMQKEPYMTTDEIASAAVFMACQPPDVNVLELIQLNPKQTYVGRG